MTEKITLPEVTDDEDRLLNLLVERLDRKARRNRLRAAVYDAKQAMNAVGTIIPPQYQRLGLVLGWAAKAVDSLARRCTLEGFTWADGDLESLGMREVWDGNMLGGETNQGLVASLKHGPAFTIVTRGGAGEPPALVHFKDALNATGEWDARARRLRNLLSIIERDDRGEPSELAMYLDGLTINAAKVDGRWLVGRQEHSYGVPADVLPYKPQLGRAFGYSRISRPVMGLQNAAVRECLRLEGHMDVYSIPEMWLLGADEAIFGNKSAWQVMLGRIKVIPDDDEAENPRAEVKQIPASSPEPHLAALNTFAKMFARETSLPDTAVAITDVANPTSAESYDASQYELIAEAEGAVDDWTPPLRRTAQRALAVANGLSEVPQEWRSVEAQWRDPRYQSRAAQADAGMKQLSAVPWLAETEVGLELLGLSEQQIRRARADQRRQGGSAALRAIQAAVEQQRPVVSTGANGSAGATPPA